MRIFLMESGWVSGSPRCIFLIFVEWVLGSLDSLKSEGLAFLWLGFRLNLSFALPPCRIFEPFACLQHFHGSRRPLLRRRRVCQRFVLSRYPLLGGSFLLGWGALLRRRLLPGRRFLLRGVWCGLLVFFAIFTCNSIVDFLKAAF